MWSSYIGTGTNIQWTRLKSAQQNSKEEGLNNIIIHNYRIRCFFWDTYEYFVFNSQITDLNLANTEFANSFADALVAKSYDVSSTTVSITKFSDEQRYIGKQRRRMEKISESDNAEIFDASSHDLKTRRKMSQKSNQILIPAQFVSKLNKF